MCDWIFPLVISGTCYGVADTLCDIVIHQDEGKKGTSLSFLNNSNLVK